MKHKILLPTDFSKNSWQAINYALKLYAEDVTEFYVLNVFSATSNVMEALINMDPGSELYNIAKEKSEKGLSETLDKLIFGENVNSKHTFKTIAVFNNTVEAIKQVVAQKDIDMIIMGTKGETQARKTAFGSVAIHTMENARNCPVIVVPENAKKTVPKEIVFPTSYNTHYRRRELNYLIEIAKKCNASIATLHISEEDELNKHQIENKELLEEILEETNFKVHSLSNNSIETAINIFVESRASDMVAFIDKKHTFFRNLLTTSVVKEITFHTKVPILVMHDLRN